MDCRKMLEEDVGYDRFVRGWLTGLRCQQACFRQSHHTGAKALHRYFPFNNVHPKANSARILNDKCHQSYLSIRTKVYRTKICLSQVHPTHPARSTKEALEIIQLLKCAPAKRRSFIIITRELPRSLYDI